ncbi:MAG: peptidase [Polaromonas sp.]|nr:peptidase [Polaromonas sp.]
MTQTPRPYPIGTPGQPWGDAEVDQWRARQVRQRSHADDVVHAIERLGGTWQVLHYGDLVYSEAGSPEGAGSADQGGAYPLLALRSQPWQPQWPSVLVTGGVHGYETSGVLGALRFAQQRAARGAGRVNLLVVPCVSPWGYERVQRWNFDAVDPNRSFRASAPGQAPPAQEAAALMRLVAEVQAQIQAQGQAKGGGGFAAHIDLHETTDTDETEFRPALAARDGQPFEPGTIPDGFYLVDDTANPQPAFQQAIIGAVAQVTHIAPADGRGHLIGSPAVGHGVIRYPLQRLGLCAGMTGARYTTTTEVYPDSPRATPGQCVAAQVAAVEAAIGFVLAQHAAS